MSIRSTLLVIVTLAMPAFSYVTARNIHDINSPYSISDQSLLLQMMAPQMVTAQEDRRRLRPLSDRSIAAANKTASVIPLTQSVAVQISIADQQFKVILDTGSADTCYLPDLRIANQFFTCVAGPLDQPIGQKDCALGSTFIRNQGEESVTYVDSSNFFVSYADGSFAGGQVAYAPIKLTEAIQFRQLVGLATTVSWPSGDNETSGVLGLGPSTLTSLYAGTDIWSDIPCRISGSLSSYSRNGAYGQCNQKHYSGVTETLMRSLGNDTNGISSNLATQTYFAVAISRNTTNSTNAGVVTFGGTPNYYEPAINISAPFVKVPMEKLNGDNATSFYIISVDGFSLEAFTNVSAATPILPHPTFTYNLSAVSTFHTVTTSSPFTGTSLPRTKKPRPMPHRRSTTSTFYSASSFDSSGEAQFVIDTGTSTTQLPRQFSELFNSQFDPPAYQDGGPTWKLNCSTLKSIPTLGIQIGGGMFEHNPEDLVIRIQEKYTEYDESTGTYATTEKEVCFSAIQDAEENEDGSSVGLLGLPFFKNTLVVFDVGRQEIGIAPRAYYQS